MSSNYYYGQQPQLGPDIPPQILLSVLTGSVSIVYYLLYVIGAAPSPIATMLSTIGMLFGDNTRELLASLFAQASPAVVASRVRRRAESLTGIPLGGGEGVVGGLWNLGNTCYQNSVLQALASLPRLAPYLRAIEEDDETECGTATELGYLLRKLNTITEQSKSESPPGVLTKFQRNGWYNEQQDAQEYMQGLMTSLEKEAEEAANRRKAEKTTGLEGVFAPPTPPGSDSHKSEGEEDLQSPFEGLYAQRVGCLQCGYVESISLQPFTTLSLPIPNGREVHLEDCLEKYTSIEEIHDVDCDKCTLLRVQKMLQKQVSISSDIPAVRDTAQERLLAVERALENDIFNPKIPGVKLTGKFAVSTTKTKQVMLCRTPPVLILHTNRSSFNPNTGYITKNYADVKFPRILDLQALKVVTNHNNLNKDPSVSMSATKDEGERVAYELKSLVCHQGGHNNGHYTTYRFVHGRWWDISDNHVEECDEEQVFSAPHAFLLFYERLAPSEIPDDFQPEYLPRSRALSGNPSNGSLYQQMGFISLSRQESEDGVLVTPPESPHDTPKRLPTPPMSEPEFLDASPEPESSPATATQLVTPPPDTPLAKPQPAETLLPPPPPQPLDTEDATTTTGTSPAPQPNSKAKRRKRRGKGGGQQQQPQAVAVN